MEKNTPVIKKITWYKRRWLQYTSRFFGIVLLFFVLHFSYDMIFGVSTFSEGSYEEGGMAGGGDSCNVTGIDIHGELFTYIPDSDSEGYYEYGVSSESLIGAFETAEQNEHKAIILDIDSGGGSSVAGEEIAQMVRNSSVPVFALIRNVGASSAYMLSAPADKIFASPYSEVGSIGVTASYVENSEKNKKEGLSYQQLTSAKFKDMGDPNRPLTEEEVAIYKRDLSIVHDQFVAQVARDRKLPLDKVRALADGSTVMGVMAKELGLIDELGNYDELEAHVKELIGEDVSVCWY